MNQQLEALISASYRAKKFLASQLFVTNYKFASKAHNNLPGVFPAIIGFVTLGHLLFAGDYANKVAKGHKTV